ncbi:MAG: PqqD family protein [Acidimicrobiales bacterium]
MAALSSHPTARTDLEVNEVDDGLVIYDLAGDRVHYLNHTASLVFVLCTGTNGAPVIEEQVATAFGLAPGEAADAVAGCLAQLQLEGLLS